MKQSLMKQIIDNETWEQTPSLVKAFIVHWKQKKYPSESPFLTLGQCIELLFYVSRNYRQEDSDGRFFNHVISNNESSIAWEGETLIDILYYECVQVIKQRIKQKLIKKQLQELT